MKFLIGGTTTTTTNSQPFWQQFSIILILLPTYCHGLLDGLYCGRENCYDVLGVTRQSSKSEIGKAYRILARKYHPDMHRDVEAKAEAEIKFKLIATAYEILKEEDSRNDYDYMLDNPDEYYAHYYRYYRRRVAPKVDVRIVIIVTLSIISVIQYYSGWQRYESAINYFATVPKYRNKALEIAKDEIDELTNKTNKGRNRLSKNDQKEQKERIIRKVIEEKMDVKGSCSKPSWSDVLWVQLLICPYTIVRFIIWHAKWFWRFNVRKEPYGHEEKLHLIRNHLKMGKHQFSAFDEKQIEDFLRQQLWIKEKFEIWREEQEEERKKKLAENPRYKSQRRYMKNHGPGRITFED